MVGLTRGDLRLRLVDYGDRLISELDLHTERRLLNDVTDSIETELNEQRRVFIEEIKLAESANLASLEELEDVEGLLEKEDEEEISKTIFRSFCFFLGLNKTGETPTCDQVKLFIIDSYLTSANINCYVEFLDHLNSAKIVKTDSCIFKFKEKFAEFEPTLVVMKTDLNNQKIVRQSVEEMTRIEKLTLINAMIESVNSNALYLLNNTQNIDLVYNKQMTSLTEIVDSVHCLLKNRQPLLTDFETNMSLAIANQRITELKSAVFTVNLHSLTTLELRDNKINKLTESSFSGLSGLQKLDLSFNQLSVVGAGMFTGLVSLRFLHLQGNRIRVVEPSTFSGDLKILYELRLELNKIAMVYTGTFGELAQLRELHLDHNQLCVVDEKLFTGLVSLKRLYLNDNQIAELHVGTFAGLVSLESLHLSNNQISKLGTGLFSELAQLRELSLNQNRIVTLERGGIFSGLGALQQLSLHRNKIKTVGAGVFDELSSLRSLDLRFNPIFENNPLLEASVQTLVYLDNYEI